MCTYPSCHLDKAVSCCKHQQCLQITSSHPFLLPGQFQHWAQRRVQRRSSPRLRRRSLDPTFVQISHNMEGKRPRAAKPLPRFYSAPSGCASRRVNDEQPTAPTSNGWDGLAFSYSSASPSTASPSISTLAVNRVPSGVIAVTDDMLAFTGSSGSLGFSMAAGFYDPDALFTEYTSGITPLRPIDCKIRHDSSMSRGYTRTGLSLPSGMHGSPDTMRAST